MRGSRRLSKMLFLLQTALVVSMSWCVAGEDPARPIPSLGVGMRVLIEGEHAVKTDGEMKNRQGAKKDDALLLKRDQSAEYAFAVSADGVFTVCVRYSNDDTGKGDDLAVLVDGELVTTIETENTRSDGMGPGEGWNIFIMSSELPIGQLAAGVHRLVLRVDDDDGFGVEVDRLTIKALSK